MAKGLEMWYGYTEDQLKVMSVDDFCKLIDSRARRTILNMNEGNSSEPFRKLIARIRYLRSKNKLGKTVRTHVRDAVILPEWLGMNFSVHNGKEFVSFDINLEKLGHRLGEYSHTTKQVKHSGAGVGATRGSKFVPLK